MVKDKSVSFYQLFLLSDLQKFTPALEKFTANNFLRFQTMRNTNGWQRSCSESIFTCDLGKWMHLIGSSLQLRPELGINLNVKIG
jgi:hypothetical protein